MAFSSSSKGQSPCEGDCGEGTKRTFYCIDCLSHYCDVCWPEQGPHKPGKISPTTKRPHEKTNRDVWAKVQAILEPPQGEDLIRALHRQDENTKWFGVTRHSRHSTQFEDTGRYAELMAESRPTSGASRIPQLVSFIGDTSAGKSTLIKMLIGRGEYEMGPTTDSFPSPVVGAASHDQIATSEGVHLYSDPETYRTSLPILYADCEGLNAGEDTPIAVKSRAHKEPGSTSGRIKRNIPGVSRDVHWANAGPEQSRRDFAVRNLYPRLLYTFSDVIVFVLKNPRTFHITLQLLLEWADDCLEKSLNQPILPHAIIVLNAVDMGNDEDRWDVEKATRSLMHDNQALINTDAKFRRFANLWRLRGWKIDNTEDLLRCYYGSISAVRIPAKTPNTYIFIHDQVAKLRATIGAACDQAYEKKTIARMLSNVDELDEYLQAGFDHFARNLDQPFNFSKVAMKHKPIPQDIGDHILTLTSAVQERMKQSGEKLFEGLSKIVASCIMFDIVRRGRKGPAEELFKNHYVTLCKAALHEFCRTNWPCEYQDKKGRSCHNFKSSHSKGHQDQKGKVIGGGGYRSAFSPDRFNDRWVQLLEKDLNAFSSRLSQANLQSDGRSSELKHAISLHQRNLTDFYGHLRSGEHYYSLATCLCCLTEVPQHPLPCGHVLCTSCVKDFGYARKEFLISLEHCPLHPEDGGQGYDWLIRFKPSFAGVRVLSLDGGGVRGIVELLVLRAIENNISGSSQDSRIPIQNFFDLIVGTSTGGIIALGLAAKRWSVAYCIQTFLGLCQQAFTEREFHDIPILQQAATLNHGSKWKTQPFHDALRSAFGKDEVLYGGKHEDTTGYVIKVAATSTSHTGQQALLLANYNRQEDRHCEYKMDFASTAEHSLKTWEVAAATSAAPSFFKPFRSLTNNSTYLDGALFHNNPVKVANSERKILWPDVAEKHPDIFLSVGTGQNLKKMELELERNVKSLASSEAQKKTPKVVQLESKKNKKRYRVWKGVKDFFSVLVNRFDSILDAEATWRAFCDETVGASWASEASTRYIRLNMDLRIDPYPLDAKERLADIQAIVDRQLQTPTYETRVTDIAHRLVASVFYFVKAGKAKRQQSGEYRIIGKICCRFDNGSNEIRALGNFFRRQQGAKFQPSFIIKVWRGSHEEHHVLLSAEVIENMRSHAHFRVSEQQIDIPNKSTPILIMLRLRASGRNGNNDCLISGFPRVFVGEDEANELMLQRRSTAIQKQRLGAIRARSGTSSMTRDNIASYTTDSRNGVEEQNGHGDDIEYYGSLDAEANLARAMWQTQLPERPVAETATALYNFVPLAEGDLEFKKGDVIEVVKRTQNPNEWWTGKFNGNEGVFPGNHVKLN